jgi:transposase InsO family protein
VHGQFTAAAPDVLWVGDITYVRTWEGWLYLATVLDVFSRRVIGWAIADHLRASLVCAALRMAVVTRGGSVADVIFHSDRGCQYTSAEFRDLCDAHGVQLSMGRTGVCWDNALAESFFATFKLELIEPATWPTRARAPHGDGALARSDLQPAAPALGHRHAEPRRLRGAVLGTPRSGLTQVSTRTGQDHSDRRRRAPPTAARVRRRMRRSLDARAVHGVASARQVAA